MVCHTDKQQTHVCLAVGFHGVHRIPTCKGVVLPCGITKQASGLESEGGDSRVYLQRLIALLLDIAPLKRAVISCVLAQQ